MATRPTDHWRSSVAEEATAAGLFPEHLLIRTDEVLLHFERELAALVDPADEQIFATIQHVVLALNKVNDDYDCAAYETGEREQLCAYIEESLAENGVDVDAFARRHGLTRHEITDEWRDW